MQAVVICLNVVVKHATSHVSVLAVLKKGRRKNKGQPRALSRSAALPCTLHCDSFFPFRSSQSLKKRLGEEGGIEKKEGEEDAFPLLTCRVWQNFGVERERYDGGSN